jgi:hypothetical protein
MLLEGMLLICPQNGYFITIFRKETYEVDKYFICQTEPE